MIDALFSPERFSTQTNESLSCAMCQEKLCQHKTQLKKNLEKIRTPRRIT